jgi:hypothetical protein
MMPVPCFVGVYEISGGSDSVDDHLVGMRPGNAIANAFSADSDLWTIVPCLTRSGLVIGGVVRLPTVQVFHSPFLQ